MLSSHCHHYYHIIITLLSYHYHVVITLSSYHYYPILSSSWSTNRQMIIRLSFQMHYMMCGSFVILNYCFNKQCAVDERKIVWMIRWMDGWIDGWIDGWMDWWMDWLMDGLMEEGRVDGMRILSYSRWMLPDWICSHRMISSTSFHSFKFFFS